MRRTHRLPARLIRWASLSVCLALILSGLTIIPVNSNAKGSISLTQGRGQRNNGKAKRVNPTPPRPGAPEVSLPNLTEARQRQAEAPAARPPIPSTVRSKRKPLESRRGRKVGDPLPPKPRASANETGDGSERVIASADKRGYVGTARSHHARTTRSLPRGGSTDVKGSQTLAVGRVFSRPSAATVSYPAVNFLRYSAFDFLRKPNLNSYDQSDAVVHWSLLSLALSEESIANAASFDLLVAPIPQASSSRIVFTSNRDGSMQIYVMNSDGSGQTRLTYNSANDDNPRWSPNGSKILFQSDRDNPSTGYMDIYVMNPDGSGQTRLTSDANDDSMASWSPDGSKIVFQSMRNGVNYQVYSMNADGSNQVCLTNTSASDDEPSWSPNGSKIAFASDRDHAGYSSVYVMNSNGANQQRLTFSASTVDDTQPAWSPNGSKIAFDSTRDSVLEQWQESDDFEVPEDDGQVITKSKLHINKEVYVMNADGSGQTRLTNDLANDDSPRWSPDGTKIVFRSDRERECCDPTAQVWTMNPDGSNPTLLSSNQFGDYSPSWGSTSNQSPVANAGGPYNGMTAQTISFNGGGSFDPDGSIVGYSWNFGDGGTGSGVSPTHAYATAGTYNIALTVTDSLGAQASTTTTATISNQSPVANAGGPYNGTVGQSVQFNGSGSYDPDGSIVSYAWTFGDGGTGSGVAPTHAYATAGTYNVTLTVTDNLGAQGSTTTTASISAPSNNQFVQYFYQWALLRQPSGEELSYWTDIMRAAYPQGQSSMLIAMREFGMTVFESAEYAARNRSNHDYAYDLYKTYLMREPDQQGWEYWIAAVPLYGREHVRRGFDESTEFINLVATLSVSGSPSSTVSSLMTARVDPFNQSGSGLLARDTEWSVPLVSLPGRAGLDLGFSLSYSSMVWTRSGPYVYFDEDSGSLSPGFRLGFPTIQEKFFDAQVGRNVYVLLTPGGGRVELRQVGTSNVYEAGDSSYLQLIDGGSLLLRTTDGTQLTYWWFNHEFRCVEIKDRNGNYINASYDWRGDIQNITDTLGRVINFNYDGNANLISITQNGRTQPWVTFGWGDPLTMHPNFSGGLVVGTHDSEEIPALRQVGLADGSRYTFEYTGAGQVNVIRRYRSDNVQSSYTAYDYQLTANDCPRISQTRVWAENWTGLNGVPTEVVTQFSDPLDGSHVMTAPDGTVYKEFYGSGWQKGLTTQSEVWSGGVRQKWTTAAWTQDNTGVSYQTNPRVTETNIYDSSGNRRRTTIDYGHYAQYGLPYLVKEYAADGVTDVRRSFTDYNLSPAYLERRIIGLVSATHLFDPIAGQWKGKVFYGYDDPTKIQSQATTATQHEQSYSASFTTRGNVTSVSRWDITDIDNAAKALTTQIGYNAAGSVLSTADPLAHQSSISYADSFSDGNNGRNTFAYPTTVTDPDGFSSTLQYNYDFGAKTRAQGPPPSGQSQGVIQTISYDSAARLQQVTTTNNGAYQRYVYGPNYVQTFSSVNSVADDAYAISVFDGAGRVIGAAKNHPGSTGGYSLLNTIYDQMGRAVYQSNPGEINNSWTPVGDDAAGLVYTQQTYDWKGRPLVTTHLTDGTITYASYGGCGCAGGEVVTLIDEVGREQKVYSDVLGRQWKAEVLNDDNSVYSTTVSVFNARDQVRVVNQYSGAAPSDASSTNAEASCPDGSCQETTVSYDGYGRLQSKHVPEQDAGTATVYSYNTDDTVNSVTDARSASATYSYNNRHLVTGITYGAPAGVTPTSNISFAYDATGNRTLMTDGTGSTSYNYNQLSQMTSETRSFSGLGSYTLGYSYNLAGQLTGITDPTNATINYAYDGAGRTTSVTGSPYGTGGINGVPYIEISQYATNLQYRAWGGLKSLTYGNNLTLSTSYDSRLRGAEFEVAGRPAQFGSSTVMKAQYQYHQDGSPKYAHDLLDERLDRAFSYDNTGSLKEAYSGSEARDYVNGTNSGTATGPYRQSYQHDAFGNMTNRTNRFWSQSDNFTANYANNRRQNQAFQYDAGGNLTQDTDLQYAYDAAGLNTSVVSAAANKTIAPLYDGDGQAVRRVETESGTTSITYYLRSSVLGNVITELNAQGVKLKTYVYLGSQVLARQESNWIVWQHNNPITGSRGMSNRDGAYSLETEPDPMGIDVGTFDPFVHLELYEPPPEGTTGLLAGSGVPNGRCVLDGMAIDCGWAMEMMSSGAAVPCPGNDCGPRTVYVDITSTSGQRRSYGGLTNPFAAYADGRSGFGLGGMLLQEGVNARFTGSAAAAAARSFLSGRAEGNFGLAVNGAITSGLEEQMKQELARRFNHAQKPGDDCNRFASVVEQLIREADLSGGLDVQRFMDRMATTFTEFPAARLGAVTGNEPGGQTSNNSYLHFGASGFHPDFYERDANQVRHAVGGLIAGYVGIPLHVPGADRNSLIQGMNDREDPNDPIHGVPDINLNNKTVPYGMKIATYSKGPSLIGPRHVGGAEAIRGLPNWIRNTLCSAWSKS